MQRKGTSFMALPRGVLAAVVLATAGPAVADHYPDVPRRVERKDQGVLDALRRLTYGDSTYITLDPVTCDCLELTCEGDHFMLSCGGEISPLGILTAVRRTSRETCLVCGCSGDLTADLTATPVCTGF
jgi:hypothetical protein